MKKIDITLHLYDEELEVTIKENEKERYMAAADLVTQKLRIPMIPVHQFR